MLIYVYSEGVETIIRSVSKFRAPWDWDPPYPYLTHALTSGNSKLHRSSIDRSAQLRRRERQSARHLTRLVRPREVRCQAGAGADEQYIYDSPLDYRKRKNKVVHTKIL